MIDEAQETVAGWLGSRQPRELMVAIIMAPVLVHAPEDKPFKELREQVERATNWADYIIKYCKEHPPA